MKAGTIPAVLITVLLGVAGCKNQNQQTVSAPTPTVSPVVQAAPSPAPSQISEASRDSFKPPKAKLMDNDDEYIDLKQGGGKAVEGCTSAYKQTVDALNRKRQARILAKVGNISDPGLRKQMTDTADASEPQIDTSSVEKVEANCRQNSLAVAQKEYLRHHAEDFFLIATYEDYYSSAQKMMFSVKKTPTPYYDIKRYGLGSPFPHCLPPDMDSPEYHDPAAYQRYYECEDAAKAQVKELGRPIEDRAVISDDRFKPDFLNLDYSCERGGDCEEAFLIDATPQDADSIFSVFGDLWTPLVNGIISDEIRAGRATHYFPPREFDGHIIDGTIRCEYTTSTCAEAMKKETLGFVRRQGIMLVGRGDPFAMKITEACVIVAGRDECLLRVKGAKRDGISNSTVENFASSRAQSPSVSALRAGVDGAKAPR